MNECELIPQTPSPVDLEVLRTEVFDYVKHRLGHGMVDVDLDPIHYSTALTRAIEIYRTRSSNAVEESVCFLRMQAHEQVYTLPQEITHVKQIYRRTVGSLGAGSTTFEPFQEAFLNTYLIGAGRSGGLLTYELWAGYNDLAARMFGGYLDFHYNIVTKKLTIFRQILGDQEIIMLQVYNLKPEIELLSDYRIKGWLKEYTYSVSKYMLGEARSVVGQIPGPNGGTTLNGEALKAEAIAEMDKHIELLTSYTTGETPLSFIFG